MQQIQVFSFHLYEHSQDLKRIKIDMELQTHKNLLAYDNIDIVHRFIGQKEYAFMIDGSHSDQSILSYCHKQNSLLNIFGRVLIGNPSTTPYGISDVNNDDFYYIRDYILRVRYNDPTTKRLRINPVICSG